MSRWNDTITLISLPESHQDSTGAWVKGDPVETEVFCNQFYAGLSDRQNPVDAGLMDVADIQLRSGDYSGQTHAVYRGREYTVMKVTESNEFTRLQLERVISDAL